MKPYHHWLVAVAVFVALGAAQGACAQFCLHPADIKSLTHGDFSCENLHRVSAAKSLLPDNCHTQGIAWNDGQQRFVMTCQGSDRGFVLSYPHAANFSGEWTATAVTSATGAAGARHPSGTQFIGDYFPVAFAPNSNSGPSKIRFFRMDVGGALRPSGETFDAGAHIGAVAYANWGGATYVIGCGWNCAKIGIWRADGLSKRSGFAQRFLGSTASLVDGSGVDRNVGSYNAIQLVPNCAGGWPLLVASHDDWIDVWELNGLAAGAIRMKKIAKRRITAPIVRHGSRPIFYEGMALSFVAGKPRYFAAPHDFGDEGCAPGLKCSQYVYECKFGR